MTKQDVYVESNTAQSLAAQASSRGKTLYSFTNEVLDVALRVLGQGGNENEIFPAWKTSRVSKTIEIAAVYRPQRPDEHAEAGTESRTHPRVSNPPRLRNQKGAPSNP